MTNRRMTRIFMMGWLAGATSFAVAEPARETSRGALLYTTHCIACHTTQVHWRDKRAATNWESLTLQVSRWQATIGLGWGADDITAVAAHLNAAYYHFPAATAKKIARK